MSIKEPEDKKKLLFLTKTLLPNELNNIVTDGSHGAAKLVGNSFNMDFNSALISSIINQDLFGKKENTKVLFEHADSIRDFFNELSELLDGGEDEEDKKVNFDTNPKEFMRELLDKIEGGLMMWFNSGNKESLSDLKNQEVELLKEQIVSLNQRITNLTVEKSKVVELVEELGKKAKGSKGKSKGSSAPGDADAVIDEAISIAEQASKIDATVSTREKTLTKDSSSKIEETRSIVCKEIATLVVEIICAVSDPNKGVPDEYLNKVKKGKKEKKEFNKEYMIQKILKVNSSILSDIPDTYQINWYETIKGTKDSLAVASGFIIDLCAKLKSELKEKDVKISYYNYARYLTKNEDGEMVDDNDEMERHKPGSISSVNLHKNASTNPTSPPETGFINNIFEPQNTTLQIIIELNKNKNKVNIKKYQNDIMSFIWVIYALSRALLQNLKGSGEPQAMVILKASNSYERGYIDDLFVFLGLKDSMLQWPKPSKS